MSYAETLIPAGFAVEKLGSMTQVFAGFRERKWTWRLMRGAFTD
jgi:hypothetical protein